MSGKYWAECYENDTDFANGVFSQRFRLTEGSVVIRYIRTWVILYLSPIFTNLKMHIYTSNNGSPISLLYTSTNEWTSADLLNGYANAYKGIYFTFDDVGLKYNTDYHLVLTGTSTNFSAGGTTLGWKYAANDPVYPPAVPLTDVNVEMKKMGFEFALVGWDKTLR